MEDKELKEPQDEVLDSNVGAFNIPRRIRVVISFLCIAVVLFIISIYVYIIFVDQGFLDPSNLGLPTLLVFSLSLLLLVTLPYEEMGVRVTKVGILELEEIVKEQNQDKTQDLAELEVRIKNLENIIGQTQDVTATLQSDSSLFIDPLENLLLTFLTDYSSWAFSPKRIKNWGGQQQKFDKLNEYSLQEIKSSLRSLLANQKIETRLSKKGNTLYILST